MTKTAKMTQSNDRRAAIARIAEFAGADLDGTIEALKDQFGLKLTEARNGSGVHKASMLKVVATSTSGRHGALTNWAAAARRALLKAG